MTMTRHAGAKAVVKEFFYENPDHSFVIHEIGRQTGYPTRTVSGAVSALAREGLIERVGHAVYRYRSEVGEEETSSPALTTDSVLFEQVAILADGDLLLRCERGELYTARPVPSTLIRR